MYTIRILQSKNHVVFLGFDYGYRGNSKYLFNYFVKKILPLKLISLLTIDVDHTFYLLILKIIKNLLKQPKIVVIESYIPDDFKPNGTVIQLWHGTPIKNYS